MKKWLNSPRLFSLIMAIVWGIFLISIFFERNDIWWTPVKMALSLEEASSKAIVLIHGKPLKELATEGKLLIAGENGQAQPVKVEAITFRLNNWDNRRADLYQNGILYAVFTVISLAFLFYNLRKEPQPEENR